MNITSQNQETGPESQRDSEQVELPARPAPFSYSSMADLFAQFEEMFLVDPGFIESTCGHKITLFDHHFFHLAAIRTTEASRLFMRDEKATIRETVDGLGKYLIDHGGTRARNLPSTKAALLDPDEVWEESPKSNSKWFYIKEFASSPYPFTVVLLTIRPEEGNIIVPVSSFPCKRTDSKKWRQGRKVFQKHIQPPEGS